MAKQTHVRMVSPSGVEWDAPVGYVERAKSKGHRVAGDPGEYDGFTKADLEREIDIRNEGRAEEERLSKSGTKADLVSTLTADDGRRS